MTVCVNASVGKVNGIKKSYKISSYKGWVSATKMAKIKYKQGVKISWKKVKGASGYEVYTYGVASKKWLKVKTTKKNSYLLTNILGRDKLKIKVRAYKKIGGEKEYGKYSKTINFKKTLGHTKKYYNNQIKPFYDRYAGETAFILQNKERVKAGSDEIVWSEELYNICYERCKDLTKDFSHDKFESTALAYLKKTYGISDLEYEYEEDGYTLGAFLVTGENIAIGQGDCYEVIDSWKRSKGHYMNMKTNSHKSGAIATYRTKTTQMWVAIFSDIDLDQYIKENYKK